MNKPQIIGFGLNGLVGSRISELLKDKFEFISLSRQNGVDITDVNSLKRIHEYPKARIILNFAAKTDVDGCESEKDLAENSEAWKINVNGVRNLARVAFENNKKLIHISTDFVFDGEKPKGEFYTEEDTPNPINWYAKTKYEGEKAVIESNCEYIILRIAYPFRAEFEAKTDFVRSIKNRLEQNLVIKAVEDHIFCPTYIDDLANVLEKLIEQDVTGIYHGVGSVSLTPYEATIKIAEEFDLDTSLISKTTRREFFKGKANRPFNLSFSNEKIERLGVKMNGFQESLHEIKSSYNSLI